MFCQGALGCQIRRKDRRAFADKAADNGAANAAARARYKGDFAV
jgi:hypothetical protein